MPPTPARSRDPDPPQGGSRLTARLLVCLVCTAALAGLASCEGPGRLDHAVLGSDASSDVTTTGDATVQDTPPPDASSDTDDDPFLVGDGGGGRDSSAPPGDAGRDGASPGDGGSRRDTNNGSDTAAPADTRPPPDTGGGRDGGSNPLPLPSSGSGGPVGNVVPNFPCMGCYSYAPRGSQSGGAAPLIVALHGDEGHAREVKDVYRGPAAGKKFVLLALKCPSSLGCSGSWQRVQKRKRRRVWQWMDRQIDTMMASYNIDRKRVYLTGWTGGAAFVAGYGAERADRFAALSFVSGGARPQTACPGCKIPVQVMVGTNDTSTADVRATRDYFKQCGHTVDYRRVRGRRGDLSGFLRRGGSLLIVDWLLKHYNRCGHW